MEINHIISQITQQVSTHVAYGREISNTTLILFLLPLLIPNLNYIIQYIYFNIESIIYDKKIKYEIEKSNNLFQMICNYLTTKHKFNKFKVKIVRNEEKDTTIKTKIPIILTKIKIKLEEEKEIEIFMNQEMSKLIMISSQKIIDEVINDSINYNKIQNKLVPEDYVFVYRVELIDINTYFSSDTKLNKNTSLLNLMENYIIKNNMSTKNNYLLTKTFESAIIKNIDIGDCIKFNFTYEEKEYSGYYKKFPEKEYKKLSSSKIYFKDKSHIDIFIEVAEKFFVDNNDNNICEYSSVNSSSTYFIKNKISIIKNDNNMFLSLKNQEKVVSIIDNFYDSRERYKSFGIPHNLGIMLQGVPGTGKTSFVYYLANKYHKNIYRINNDITQITTYTMNIEPNSIVLFDDIDMLSDELNRGKEEPKKETFDDLKMDIKDIVSHEVKLKEGATNNKAISRKNVMILDQLIKCLDGYTCLENCIVIATTNYIEKLDNALIRPGRFDHIFEFGKMDEYQIKNICQRFFGDKYIPDEETIQKLEKYTTSKLINTHVIPNIDNVDNFAKEISQLE
jgi:hypothetical protein